ncbi:hypothetical protein VW23_001675 [Devosia insulae DS-56]|uniref:Uncharacterized protein n=1 Tax=Devosia insulae DS-56 TaxID=1116389 RepID=A0A1E5XMD0_9HYPH|nr:hypothetical protein VW23_001675 [Devosia insulae DS-56]
MRSHADVLPWDWAVTEQTWLHHKHDAFLVGRVHQSTFGESHWLEFLNAYSLKRGKGGNFLRQSYETSWPVLVDAYSSPMRDGDVFTATTRWTAVVEALRQGSGLRMRSAALKAFWLFQPHALPMFDAFASRGLVLFERARGERGQAVTIDNFLERFEAFYHFSGTQIEGALERSGSTYPYRRRIGEKWLWLAGNTHREAILDRFAAAQDDLERVR